MPKLRFQGINEELIASLSKEIADIITQETKCPRDYVEIELLNVKCFRDGDRAEASPFVEIYWFDRGDSIADGIGERIYSLFRDKGGIEIESAFLSYRRRQYYEGGKNLDE